MLWKKIRGSQAVKGEPQGNNLKKKGLRQFFEKCYWRVKKSLGSPAL